MNTFRQAGYFGAITCLLSLLAGCGGESPAPDTDDVGTTPESLPATASELWGERGELWSPEGRLPDFSYAGYHRGEMPIPNLPVQTDVRDFGAVGDGVTDDSDAFLRAIDSVNYGAVFIPNGRYLLTQVLAIDKSGVVLRGESRNGTVLYFPGTLHGTFGHGRDGGPYGWSWGGGWIWVNRDMTTGDSTRNPWRGGQKLATVTGESRRGERVLTVDSTEQIQPGRQVRLVQWRTDGSLLLEMHGGHPLRGLCQLDKPGIDIVDWMVEVESVKGDRLTLERPLRVPVAPKWDAEIRSFEAPVEEVGIEHLTIEFPVMQYEGHHNEPGQSAISLAAAYNSWVRDVAIVNFDNGIQFWYSKNCTAESILLTGRGGHYGANLAGCQDCLLTGFRIENSSVHDLSVANLGNGNVVSWGKGVQINFDHHRFVPYENLFSAIDVGESWRRARLWASSGTKSGHNAAARETFWNIQPRISTRFLPRWPELNVIGPLNLSPKQPVANVGWWVEDVDPIAPADLHRAQLARRLGRELGPPPTLPEPLPGVEGISVVPEKTKERDES